MGNGEATRLLKNGLSGASTIVADIHGLPRVDVCRPRRAIKDVEVAYRGTGTAKDCAGHQRSTTLP